MVIDSVSALFFVQYQKTTDSMCAFYKEIQIERLIETVTDQGQRVNLISKFISQYSGPESNEQV